jgi:glucose/arabinose dehydrogenase
MKNSHTPFHILLALLIISCNSESKNRNSDGTAGEYKADTVQTAIGELVLPPPFDTESKTKNSKIIDWPEGVTPKAPEGFTVTKFADGFDNPRWTYIAPRSLGGDYFVSQSNTRGSSAEQITLLRDTNGDGSPEVREIFIEGLNKPFGMLAIGNSFYVANTDGLYKYPYQEGQTSIDAEGEKITDLPAGGYNNHWTRNIITNEGRDKIFISVGSSSNVAENGLDEEKRRANILVVDLNGGNEKVYASGLRNPVGMDWNPANGELWTAVNERDQLGDNLVPDYITSVKEGGFYGWPFSYFGQIVDPRMEGQGEDLVAKAIVPDVPVGSHTASLGLAFYDKEQFPEKYRNGAFVGQHGSWNRSVLSGYKVVFVPFANGKPSGPPEDFLTGFIADESNSEVYGRPVAVTVTPAGDLLVNDDSGNTIWKVSYSE